MSELVFVIINENGTKRFVLDESVIVIPPTVSDAALQSVNAHIGDLANPHQTSLQQAVTKQGVLPVIGEIKIGSTQYNDELVTLLKSAIVFALSGDVRSTSIDVNGFHHTNQDGLFLDVDNGGVHLYSGNNTISINYDGTITGLLDSPLASSAVTRGYVESLAFGLKPHAPVRIMVQDGSTEHLNYNAAGSGVGKTMTSPQNGAFNYQGLLYSQGDRIGAMFYAYQRVDAGIYVLTQVGDDNTPWILTRATDFDGSSNYDSKQADILFVLEGTYAQCMFIETQRGSDPNTGNLLIDTDLVTWELFHAPQDLTFEQGLHIDGQNVSVKPDTTTGDSMIPVTVSTAGVGVQKSIITAIADEKKGEANAYTDSQILDTNTSLNQAKVAAISQCETFASGLKTQSDLALQTIYTETQTNDQAVQTAAKNYTDSQIVITNNNINQAKADAIVQSEAFAYGLKTASDQALQVTYVETQTNDQTVQAAAKTYTDTAIQTVNQEITALAASIPSGSSKPMIYPQFFLLNGQMIQNYSDYLFMDNAYRSGNDGGLNSSSCIPFLVPEAAILIGISFYLGAVAVSGNYAANTNVNVNFELRQMVVGGTNTLFPFSIPINGASGQIGSNGNFPAVPQAFAGGLAGLNISLTKSVLLGIKFINNTTGSAVIASTIKNVVIKLEIRVG
jgi:hypothetical protein